MNACLNIIESLEFLNGVSRCRRAGATHTRKGARDLSRFIVTSEEDLDDFKPPRCERRSGVNAAP
jgi:hypothetical protein